MRTTRCRGWWEQGGVGRQPMDPLALVIDGARVSGSGADVVGPFSFTGVIGPGGRVGMLKRYTWRHWVWYGGHYDGVRRLWGRWRLVAETGLWEVTLDQALESEEALGAEEPAPLALVGEAP